MWPGFPEDGFSAWFTPIQAFLDRPDDGRLIREGTVMVDILLFVYENFFGSGIYPAHSVLVNRLYAAGFEENAVRGTLAWLDSLGQNGEVVPQGPTSDSIGTEWQSTPAQRFLVEHELERLGQEGWDFLAFLENAKVLSAAQRELILGGLMALDLDENEPDLDRLKLMALMVLWRQGRPWDALLIEELIYFQDSLVH
ncbi:DUF494 family protein [Ferrovum sp.]|uniref:DUF494 family protein n=1 Tax=Ferrovum sp. TaxID=2609467 RepID=UPI00260D0BB6|nr:DUF494 domain-containing protein [Ferrovum sp.]